MRAITWIRNVFTGRIRHWTSTHNVVVNALWQSSERLPPIHRLVLRSFGPAVDFILESILLTERKKWRTTQIDLRKIEVGQFRQLYAILLTYFVCLLCLYRESFRSMAHELHRAVETTTGEVEITRKVVAIFDQEKSTKALDQARKPSGFLFAVEAAIWDEIARIIGLGNRTDLGQKVTFSLVVSTTYLSAAQEID